jgi:putative peptidoglycan lipid II flippase
MPWWRPFELGKGRGSGSGRSIGLIAVLGWLGAAVAIASVALRAELFGTDRTVEIYFAASALYLSLVQLTRTGLVFEVFVPVYQGIRAERGQPAAFAAFSALLNWILLFGLGMGLVAWLAAAPLIGLFVPGFDRASMAETVAVFRWLAPLLVVNVITVACLMFLNVERRFGRPEAWGVVGKLSAFATLAAVGTTLGVWGLVAALYADAVVRALGLAATIGAIGYRHRLLLSVTFPVRPLLAGVSAGFGHIGAYNVFQFAFNAALSMLPQGGLAVYRYGWDLFNKLRPLALRPVGTVFFSEISRHVARGGAEGKQIVRRAQERNLLMIGLILPAALVGAELVLQGLLGSAAFGTEPLQQTVSVFRGLVLLLPTMAVLGLMQRTAVSVGLAARGYAWTTAVTLLYAPIAWALITALGVLGAVVTVWCLTLSTQLVYVQLIKRHAQTLLVVPMATLLRWLTALLPAVLLGLWLQSETRTVGEAPRLAALAAGGLFGVAASLVAVLLAGLLGVKDARSLLRTMVRCVA